MWPYNDRKNTHFNNGWEIHVNFENYKESGYNPNLNKLLQHFKLVHDSFKLTRHVSIINTTIVDLNLQQLHEYSKQIP